MARTRRSFTLAFKQEAVALTRQPDVSVLSVARNLGIRASTLQYWIDHPPQAGPTSRPAVEVQSDDPAALKLQLKEAQKRIARLEMERDILKKATAFFANRSP